MKMKKLFALLLSLAMLLAAVSAAAETPAESILSAGESLFFRTENVTLNGKAAFYLDGEVFKTADGEYVQDGENSFWQLKLLTPRPGQGDKASGYTIIANKEQVFVMEVVHPGIYRTGYIFPQSTILRNSVQLDLMTQLARNLARQADTLAGEGAFTAEPGEQGETEIRIALDGNAPDLVHTALTLAYQYIASRYFRVNFDQISSRYTAPIGNYTTTTQGILYTTEYIYLKEADIRVTLDAAGELQSAAGLLSVYLQTGADGEHQLDIDFTFDASNRGTSKVDAFDPESYGVVPPDEFSQPQ